MNLYIVGAGGHAREVHAYIEDLRRNGWSGELLGCLDDNLAPGRHGPLDVIGAFDCARDGSAYITAVGSNAARKKMVERLAGLTPWTLAHPRAWTGAGVEIGPGTLLAPGSIVTAQTKIGRHCILNVKASVSHDCIIGDYVNINPGATVCGTVTAGEGAYIGAGAVVKERINIGAWSVIGAGAVVIRDVPPSVTVAGVPARIIKQPVCNS
jgi:sugar O-acyltransferase (sialic acid O-acetyltransferase NeuD family)